MAEAHDDRQRRAYWSQKMDEADAFMQQVRDYPVEESGEPVVAAVTPANGAPATAARPGEKPKRQHIIVRTNDPRFGDASPQQRRSAPPRPLPPPPGPADWLSRLFR